MDVIAAKPEAGSMLSMVNRGIWILCFEGFQSLDVAGPWEVFHGADRLAQARGRRRGYGLSLVGPHKGPVASTSGLTLLAERGLGAVRGELDTLVIAGGEGARAAAEDDRVVRFIERAARRARRIASVCTGAFPLAAAGLLDGRRATTHWAHCDRLAAQFPRVQVESDPIFLKQGRVYTSAGVTAGMDLALSLVEEDLGREASLAVARHLVMFAQRPGGQSQFSAQLQYQKAQREPLREVQRHVLDNLAAELSVEQLARHAGMSPRHFARVFGREVGTTPATYVERMRVEAARGLLEQTGMALQDIAGAVGLGSVETLRRAFARQLDVSPSDYRRRFRAA